jgi:hypothetical protein
MNRSDRLQVLESRFERELAKRTEILRRSLRMKFQGTPVLDKREVFDLGLQEWARSLAEAVGEYLPRFVTFRSDRTVERRLSSAEQEIRQNLYKFLGVAELGATEAWPDSCRVLKFTRSVCGFIGYRRPRGFDLTDWGRPNESSPLAEYQFQIQSVFDEFGTILEKELCDEFDDRLIDATRAAATKPDRSRHAEEGGLPEKQHDLSELFDDAKLAPRQRQIASLAWEHGMKIGDIAQWLNLHRSTVDESLKGAQRRTNQSRENDRNRRASTTRKAASSHEA